ncbi:MAG: DUF2520 domain-containing protein [Chloroflexi bacterium]|nr:DUF2520 domain-containing protein [Chloroflexota bacterium]
MGHIKTTIGFIGAGVTGTALAYQLWRQGYRVVAASSRSIASAQRLAAKIEGCAACSSPQQVADLARVVFITTPDDIIADIAARLKWHPGQTLIHCSGVHSTDILEPAQKYGAHVCCLHPLQTFAGIDEAISNIPGSTFAIEGDDFGLSLARQLATALQGNIIVLKPGDKVLYHAAAVTLSNYLVTLMKTSADLWQSFGIPREEAIKAMLPLLKGTVNNIERVGIPGCLTGPIARGDVETIRKHVAALEKDHPDAIDTYRLMGLKTLGIALARGHLSLETAGEIRDILEGHGQHISSYYDDLYRELGIDFKSEYSSASADKLI